MYSINYTHQFKKDLRRCKKRGLFLQNISHIMTPSPYSIEELREEVMDEFFDDETMDLETARAMLHQTVREEYAKP